MNDVCKLPGCDRLATEGIDPHSARFCSDACEVKHNHLRDDARDARMDDMEVGR